MTVVNPPGRFGTALIENDIVKSFDEKPVSEKGWINGGFFVFEPDIFSFIRNDAESLEGFPLKTLSKKNQLSSFKHKKFWQPMDTLRDKKLLENLWETKAPWKIW